MNSDGSNVRVLTDTNVGPDHTWSPDGTEIAFCRKGSGGYEIWKLKTDGSDPTRLSRHEGHHRNPAWSPDGATFAYTRQESIWLMNSDGTNPRQLTDNPESSDRNPSWSPDGRHIAFVYYVIANGHQEIYVHTIDDEDQWRVTFSAGYSCTMPDWADAERRTT